MEDMIRNEIATMGHQHQDMIVMNPGMGQVTLMDIRRDKQRYPRLYQYERQDAITNMAKIVLTAYQYRGQSADTENVAFIASSLVDELMADYDRIGSRFITFEEISRAVKKAVLGQGKEIFGISFASLYMAIVDYIKGEGHEAEKMCQALALKQRREAFKKSAVCAMAESYAGQMIQKQKRNGK